jgi:hypothetical protein
LSHSSQHRNGRYLCKAAIGGRAAQRVEYESRAHIDIETDDIPAEVARRERHCHI